MLVMNATQIALQTENPEWILSRHRVNFNSIQFYFFRLRNAHDIHDTVSNILSI